jgi:hypothetical protein
MSARPGIENTLARYCWAFHVDDVPFMGECFHADAQVTFPKGPRRGREAVLAELDRIRDGFRRDATRPVIVTNVFITREDDREAEAHTCFLVSVRDEAGEARPYRAGYYDDVFVLDRGVWTIARRTVLSR